LSFLDRRSAARCPLIFYGQIPGIFGDQLAHLIAQFLPFADVITSHPVGERLGPLLFEDREYGARFRLLLPGLDLHLSVKDF
jgi:hypothetical protein